MPHRVACLEATSETGTGLAAEGGQAAEAPAAAVASFLPCSPGAELAAAARGR